MVNWVKPVERFRKAEQLTGRPIEIGEFPNDDTQEDELNLFGDDFESI